MTPRNALFLVCLLGAAHVTVPEVSAGEGTPAAAPAIDHSGPHSSERAPVNLKELGQRLDALTRAVELLAAEARRDPDDARISQYQGYSAADFKSRKRAVRASMLVDFLADATKTPEVREHAYTALVEGPMQGDPDLSRSTKRGRMRERAYFANKYLVPLIRADDRQSRVYAHQLLSKWWIVRDIPAINTYNPDNARSCKAASDAWKKELRRRK